MGLVTVSIARKRKSAPPRPFLQQSLTLNPKCRQRRFLHSPFQKYCSLTKIDKNAPCKGHPLAESHHSLPIPVTPQTQRIFSLFRSTPPYRPPIAPSIPGNSTRKASLRPAFLRTLLFSTKAHRFPHCPRFSSRYTPTATHFHFPSFSPAQNSRFRRYFPRHFWFIHKNTTILTFLPFPPQIHPNHNAFPFSLFFLRLSSLPQKSTNFRSTPFPFQPHPNHSPFPFPIFSPSAPSHPRVRKTQQKKPPPDRKICSLNCAFSGYFLRKIQLFQQVPIFLSRCGFEMALCIFIPSDSEFP